MTDVMLINVKTLRSATCKLNLRVRRDAFRWAPKLDAFLSFNDRPVLVGAGKVPHEQAVAHAQSEYEKFAAQRRSAIEAEGAAYTVRLIGAGSTDERCLVDIDQIAKRLTKKTGGRNAS